MQLENLRLMNAAGWIKRDGASFRNLIRSPVTDIVFGSITVLKRPGNTGTNFVVQDDFSVNSLGLPNDGLEEYEKSLPALVQSTQNAKKRFRLSIAPLGLDDCTILADFATKLKVDTLELNLGCPNVHVEGKQKPIFAYDLEMAQDAILDVEVAWKGPLAVKVSPYYQEEMDVFAKNMASLLDSLQAGDSVVISNTLPNFSPKDVKDEPLLKATTPEKQVITAGGMGGKRLMPHSLKDVRRFREWLRPEIEIDAAGGIENGNDVYEFHKAGASKFQVGTAYFKNDDPRIFSRILEELA